MKNIIFKSIVFISIIIAILTNYIFITNKVEVEPYKLYFTICNIAICLFIIILIHELGHQVIAVILGISSCVFFAYPFLIIKRNNRWDIKINMRHLFQYSGFIIPKVPVIRNFREYNIVIKKIAISTIFGPIVSIIFGMIGFVFTTNIELLILIKNIFCVTSLVIGMYTLFFGDGPMFLLLSKNENYAMNIFMTFNHYSNNYFSNDYLYVIAKERCKKINFEIIDENVLTEIQIQGNIIENSIIKGNCIDNEVVKKNIETFLDVYHKLDIIYEEVICYIHLIIMYLIVIEKDFNSANKLYNYYFLEYEDLKNGNYLVERTKYFLGYSISLEKIIYMLENSIEYYISENYINIEKKILNSYYQHK